MNYITRHILNTTLPYLIAFLLGVIVAWKGCGEGTTEGTTKVVTIDKPIPVEVTKETPTKDGRFVQPIPVNKPKGVFSMSNDPEAIIHTNTPYASNFDIRIDTSAIIDAWLSERVHYDTSIEFTSATVRMMWSNYQNVSENLVISYLPKRVVRANFALGIHGNAGLISDFESTYVPLMGLGVQATVKKSYFSVDYGFNGDHYVGFRVGRNIVNL